MNWRSFFIGLLVGLTAEWIINAYYWGQRTNGGGASDASGMLARLGARADVEGRQREREVEVQHQRAGGEPPVRAAAAIPAGAGEDNLEMIDGIGPKIGALLREAGIRTFADLAAAEPGELEIILRAGGSRFQMANPASWPRQAELAASGRWDELQAFQDSLTAGGEEKQAE